MYLLHAVFYVFLLHSSSVFGTEFDYDGWLQLKLWHSLADSPNPQFVERGNITVSSIRSGATIVAQLGLDSLQMKQLHTLAERDGKYLLKINIRSSRGSETTFLTHILACQLIGSDLEDILHIWLDNSAEPVAVNILSQGPCSIREALTKMWTTNVHIKYPDGGPVPDTATYIQKLEREKEARERGDTKDNRSFFAKYWMYIVPAVLVVILSSATNPEAGSGASGGAVQRQ